MNVAWLTVATPLGIVVLAACGAGAPRDPLPPLSVASASAPAASLASSASSAALLPPPPPSSVIVLVSAGGEKKCVELARTKAEGAPTTLTLTAGTSCRPATLALVLEKSGDAEVLRSAQLHVAPVHLPNAMGRGGGITESCAVTDPTLATYASNEACETARAGAAPPSLADGCAQGLLDRAYAQDPRLARADDAALLRAMQESGNLFVITGKSRQCMRWTFERGKVDAFHGGLVRRFAQRKGKEQVVWSRSYAYDPSCKALGLSGYGVTVSSAAGGHGHGSSDRCSVIGVLERASSDAIDVGDRTLFLTEGACKAAARAPAPKKGAASPYVADDEGC